MSFQGSIRLWITLIAAALACALPAHAQYPGQITDADKNTPKLRAVGVLEWAGGDADHPNAGRIIPVCIYDGQALQDAGIYLSRPEPLALESEVEYQLQRNGRPVGLFDIERAAREMGSWVGLGKLKPLPKPKPASMQTVKIDDDDSQSDAPILYRKHHAGDSGGGGSSSTESGPGSQAPAADPDRPTLHRSPGASAGSSTSTASGNSGDGSASSTTAAQSSDPDRPTMHKSGDASSSGGSSTSASDSGGPKLNKKQGEDEGYVEDVTTVTDPERPRVFRGKSAGFDSPAMPTPLSLPSAMYQSGMHQEVAVSDKQNQPLHPWSYIWADPGDESKMMASMEDQARAALGLNPPSASAPKPESKTGSAPKTAKSEPPIPPAPAPLLDEQFRVFELAYGSGATLVLTARTDGAGAEQKFVTLIAQPNLYGNLSVLMKNVTDAAHLDETPRMELVDAVDAMADNRGELLFELRGTTQRQFALYRVLRGQATQLFVSGPDTISTGAASASAPAVN